MKKALFSSFVFSLLVLGAAATGFFIGSDRNEAIEPERLRRLLIAAAALVLVFTLAGWPVFARLAQRRGEPAKAQPAPASPGGQLAAALVGFAVFTAIGLAIGSSTGRPIASLASFDGASLAFGVAATLPLVLLLAAIMRLDAAPIRAFRERQIELFAKRGWDFNGFQIVVMSLGAGISEEILFRGAGQTWLVEAIGLWPGLVAASVIFGLFHAANVGYAIISTLIGLYLGGLFVLSGNLLVPVTTHALYDVYALHVTARAIDAYRKAQAAN